MPQSFSAVHLHLVFSTKGRQPLIDAGFRDPMHRYLAGIAKSVECPALEVGGTEDHVHVLALLGRSTSQADLVKNLKARSSLWAKEHRPGFAWQAGYGAFSVGRAEVGRIRAYIQGQEDHHRTLTFQDEFLQLLRQHDLEWDERYIWD